MKATIIPSDNVVMIDGRHASVDCSMLNKIIHVVQWDCDQGEIEYKTIDKKRPPNNVVTDLSEFQLVIDAAKAFIAHEDAVAAQRLAEIKAKQAHAELEKASAAVNPLQAHLEKTLGAKLEEIHKTAANIKATIEEQIKLGHVTTTQEIDDTIA